MEMLRKKVHDMGQLAAKATTSEFMLSLILRNDILIEEGQRPMVVIVDRI